MLNLIKLRNFQKGGTCGLFGSAKMDIMFALAQSVGFVATGVAISSFQAKKRMNMLIMQTVSNLLWLAHYLMLGSLTAGLANLICTLRNVVYGMRGKYKFADSKLVPAISIVAFIISGIFTYETPFDILPTLASICASIAFFVKDEKLIRYISVFIALFWLSFGFYVGSIASMVSDGSTLISIIIAIIRYRNFDIYETTTARYTEPAIIDDENMEEKLSDDAFEGSVPLPYSYD